MDAGHCASKILQSAIPVEVGDGEPCNSKDTRDVDGLEITEVPKNDHIGIRASPPKKVMGSLAKLKCNYTIACSMGNKQEKLEAIVQKENYDIDAITKTYWDDLYNWSAARDGYTLFGRDRLGRRGGEIAVDVRDCFDCLEFNDYKDRVECLRVRIGEGQQGRCHGGSLL